MYLINDDPPPEWAIFLSLNLGFPIVAQEIDVIWSLFPIEGRFWIGITLFLVLAGLNVWRWRTVPAWRKGYAAILVLNTISLFAAGAISVFLAIYGTLHILF